jgi:SAM-dependent methyltransferase
VGLKAQYDNYYQSSLIKKTFPNIELRGWPRDRVEAIIFAICPGETVLDVGCGNGGLLYQLRHHYKKLIGLEFSPHRLEQAKVNLSELSFMPILGSAENMSEVTTNSIDCVVSADTIEHIPDVYAATQEIYRVLRKGGTLIINTPNIAFVKKRLLLLFGRFPATAQNNEGLGGDILFDSGHLHYFTFRSLQLLLKRYGFEIQCCMGYGIFGRIHNLYPALMSGGVQVIARKPI